MARYPQDVTGPEVLRTGMDGSNVGSRILEERALKAGGAEQAEAM